MRCFLNHQSVWIYNCFFNKTNLKEWIDKITRLRENMNVLYITVLFPNISCHINSL